MFLVPRTVCALHKYRPPPPQKSVAQHSSQYMWPLYELRAVVDASDAQHNIIGCLPFPHSVKVWASAAAHMPLMHFWQPNGATYSPQRSEQSVGQRPQLRLQAAQLRQLHQQRLRQATRS